MKSSNTKTIATRLKKVWPYKNRQQHLMEEQEREIRTSVYAPLQLTGQRLSSSILFVAPMSIFALFNNDHNVDQPAQCSS